MLHPEPLAGCRPAPECFSSYVIITIEVHGYFTTRPKMMEKMLAFSKSPYLRMNLDTGNTFIAGQPPPNS